MEAVNVVDEGGKELKAVIVTKEEIAGWEEEKYRLSEEAVRKLPAAYDDLKTGLDRTDSLIDIDSWYPLARRIANACKRLTVPTSGTIFYYPMKNIDPEIYGSAATFRREALVLKDQVRILDRRLNLEK